MTTGQADAVRCWPWLLLAAALLMPIGSADAATEQGAANRTAQGKAIAFDRSKGNCLSCHVIEDGEMPGNAGPPLVGMRARFPDRQALRQQVADPTIRNPRSMMPPFGRHRILSDEELDLVVDYLYTL